MEKYLINILNEGFTPEQASAVRGGAAETSCTCNGAKFHCTNNSCSKNDCGNHTCDKFNEGKNCKCNAGETYVK